MQVLELGIVVHAVVVGLSMGASDNTCTIKSLVAAMCCHQLFEGMGLGGCILRVTPHHNNAGFKTILEFLVKSESIYTQLEVFLHETKVDPSIPIVHFILY